MLLLQAGTAWTPAQVQDTVNRIVSRAAYQRDFTESLLSQIVGAIVRFIDGLIRAAVHAANTRSIVYLVLGALAVLLLLRLVLDLRAELDGTGVARSRRVGGQVSDPWNDAERLAQAGRYTDAAHALLAALLGALGARGEVRVHASKTAGDYARELRRRNAPSAPRFQSFRTRYDRAVYGTGDVSGDEYRALLDDARPMLDAGRAK
jgi:hypothetical protein